MVARRPTVLATMAESPFEAPDTPRFSLHRLALEGDSGFNKNEPGSEHHADRIPEPHPVYVSTTPQIETAAHLKGTLEEDEFMPRGGSEQLRPGSSRRQSGQSSQQRRYPPPNPPPDSPQNYNAPVYVTPQYAPPHPGYVGQYMMSPQPPVNMAHSPGPQFPYPPPSIHAGFPTIVSYTQQYPPDAQSYASQTSPNPAYRYTTPLPPASYSGYQQPGQFPSQPAMYPTHGVFPPTSPYSSYPSPAGHQHPSPPQQEGESGTWWFVPSPPPQQQQQQQPQYELGGQQQTPSVASFFYGAPSPLSPQPPPDSPAHQQHASYTTSPTYVRAPTPSSSAPSPPPAAPKPLVRRAYHPNPPAHRSEWVMWAGNVPSDAGHDELWRFFTAPPSTSSSEAGSASTTEREAAKGGGEVAASGVLSIFLISRSSCAFVNYDTEAALEAAIARFNGVPLRPADPRCPRLVCRVRRRDDDLRAGVGGQRGMGLHTKHVREKAAAAFAAGKGKGREWDHRSGTDEESSESAVSQFSALSLNSDDNEPIRPPLRPHTQGSASSGSHASVSTNSSLLARHFPQRYFILKSLTRDDLDLSVRQGVWATQRHNEGVLDQAFRTSQDVFLIFSVNKSGEFYGYARMAGPVGQEEGGGGAARVMWAVRSPPVSPSGSPATGRDPPAATSSHPLPHGDPSAVHQVPQRDQQPRSPMLSDTHQVDESPSAMPGETTAAGRIPKQAQSAPAVLGKPASALSGVDPGPSHSLDGYRRRIVPADIQLDENAPLRAMRNVSEGESDLGRVPEELEVPTAPGVGAGAGQQEDSWGQNFALQWLCTERLPFTRTRHIRNPWNHEREVKVSRDGTELEPGVGQALLEEWQAYLAELEAQEGQEQAGDAPATAPRRTAGTSRS